jgi:hypothetical protein
MENFDLGSALLIPVKFKVKTPFGSADGESSSEAYYDPTSYTITVYDEGGTIKVDGVALTKSATGKYYYIVQTTTDWDAGIYKVTVESGNGSNDDVTTEYKFFRLI